MAGVLAGSILLSAIVAYAAGRTLIEAFCNINDIVINSTSKRSTDNKSFIYNGTTYAPLRFDCENLEYGVDWDGSTFILGIIRPALMRKRQGRIWGG